MLMEPSSDFEDAQRRVKVRAFDFSGIRKLLDVGGGSGAVWDSYPNSMLIDLAEPDESLAERARSKGVYNYIFPSTAYMQYNTMREDYDAVSLFGVLEHIEDDNKFISQFKSWKKILITVPNAYSFHRLLGVELGMLDNVYELHAGDIAIGHQRVYCPMSLLNLLEPVFGSTHSIRIGTCGFKFSNNEDMVPFLNRYDELQRVALSTDLVGDGNIFGAEIYAEVSI